MARVARPWRCSARYRRLSLPAVFPRREAPAHGVSNRVDRLKGLGNAIVPQVAAVILKEIRKLIETQTPTTKGDE